MIYLPFETPESEEGLIGWKGITHIGGTGRAETLFYERNWHAVVTEHREYVAVHATAEPGQPWQVEVTLEIPGIDDVPWVLTIEQAEALVSVLTSAIGVAKGFKASPVPREDNDDSQRA
jgi:hypothetical protein